jgi:hypothetical protein
LWNILDEVEEANEAKHSKSAEGTPVAVPSKEECETRHDDDKVKRVEAGGGVVKKRSIVSNAFLRCGNTLFSIVCLNTIVLSPPVIWVGEVVQRLPRARDNLQDALSRERAQRDVSNVRHKAHHLLFHSTELP